MNNCEWLWITLNEFWRIMNNYVWFWYYYSSIIPISMINHSCICYIDWLLTVVYDLCVPHKNFFAKVRQFSWFLMNFAWFYNEFLIHTTVCVLKTVVCLNMTFKIHLNMVEIVHKCVKIVHKMRDGRWKLPFSSSE